MSREALTAFCVFLARIVTRITGGRNRIAKRRLLDALQSSLRVWGGSLAFSEEGGQSRAASERKPFLWGWSVPATWARCFPKAEALLCLRFCVPFTCYDLNISRGVNSVNTTLMCHVTNSRLFQNLCDHVFNFGLDGCFQFFPIVNNAVANVSFHTRFWVFLLKMDLYYYVH